MDFVDVVVLGGAATEYAILGNTIPRGQGAEIGYRFVHGAGGKGLNQAVAAARLGARVGFIGKISDDQRGHEILKVLADENINSDFVFKSESAETGANFFFIGRDGLKSSMMVPGANMTLTLNDLLAAQIAIQRSKVLLVQLEVPIDLVEWSVSYAKSLGKKIVLDWAPPHPLSQKAIREADVLRLDAPEATRISGVNVIDFESARAASEKLRSVGASRILIQAGQKGNLLVFNDGQLPLPRVPVRAVDTTGAGDSLSAAVAVALSRGQDLVRAATWGNMCAALSSQQLGALPSLPTYDEVQGFVKKYKQGEAPFENRGH